LKALAPQLIADVTLYPSASGGRKSAVQLFIGQAKVVLATR
jgi:hypothetical protein